MPIDVVEMPMMEWLLLLGRKAQEPLMVAADPETGFPVLVEPPPLSMAQLNDLERDWRNVQLSLTDGVVTRHRDEIEEGTSTTLSADQYTDLQSYRRLLRAWPEAADFPYASNRPPAPIWLVEHIR
jgi:hypothetical protein